MTIDELVAALKAISESEDYGPESAHVKADALLLDYIADERVTAAYHDIDKWYV